MGCGKGTGLPRVSRMRGTRMAGDPRRQVLGERLGCLYWGCGKIHGYLLTGTQGEWPLDLASETG